MIIRNCPANTDIPEGHIDDNGKFIVDGYEDRNYCEKYKRNCNKVQKCLVKNLYCFLNKIENMLSLALDADETTSEESIELIYDVLNLVEEEERKLNATYNVQKQ
jgi:hypothetical protein